MSDREERKRRLRKASREAALRADELLEAEFQVLRKASSEDWESLRPKVTSAEEYEKLIAAVREATRLNESAADFRTRIEGLGSETMKIAKTVVKFLS